MDYKLKRLINTVYVVVRYQGEIYYDVVRLDDFFADDERISDIRHIIRDKKNDLPNWFGDIADFTDEEIFTGNTIEPKKEAKQDETLDTNDDDTPITDAKIKRLKELQRKKALRERLKRAKIRRTLPRTGGTSVYYYIVPGGILMLSAMGLMLKRKKKK